MTRLSCARCGQRYYGPPSPGLVCDFCHARLEESLWSPHGRRADMVPLPVVRAPLPPAPAGAQDERERLLRTLRGAS